MEFSEGMTSVPLNSGMVILCPVNRKLRARSVQCLYPAFSMLKQGLPLKGSLDGVRITVLGLVGLQRVWLVPEVVNP